ncbi:unnamed protein product [Prunus brigantina]
MHELLKEMSNAISANQAFIIAIQNLLVSHGISGASPSSKTAVSSASPLNSSDPNNSAAKAHADSVLNEDFISTLPKSHKRKTAEEVPCASVNPSPNPITSLVIPIERRKLPARKRQI